MEVLDVPCADLNFKTIVDSITIYEIRTMNYHKDYNHKFKIVSTIKEKSTPMHQFKFL